MGTREFIIKTIWQIGDQFRNARAVGRSEIAHKLLEARTALQGIFDVTEEEIREWGREHVMGQ